MIWRKLAEEKYKSKGGRLGRKKPGVYAAVRILTASRKKMGLKKGCIEKGYLP